MDECLFDRWVMVPGDGSGDAQRYRRAADAPRSRHPRSVLEFGRDGAVVRYLPGPADGRVAYPGRWDPAGESRLVVVWADGSPETLVEVVACDDEFLEVRVLAGTLGEAGPGAGDRGR